MAAAVQQMYAADAQREAQAAPPPGRARKATSAPPTELTPGQKQAGAV
jgi:hypothetical protein